MGPDRRAIEQSASLRKSRIFSSKVIPTFLAKPDNGAADLCDQLNASVRALLLYKPLEKRIAIHNCDKDTCKARDRKPRETWQ